MRKSWIEGWRTFLVQLTMVISITWVALETQSTDLCLTLGGVYSIIMGTAVYGKKIAGEQEILKKNGGSS